MHFRIQDNQWAHDEKKIGFMDMNGKIVIEPFYNQIYKDSPKKGLIQLQHGTNYCTIDASGKLIEGQFATGETDEQPDYELHESAEQYALPTNDSNKKHRRNKRKRARWL
jgi:hypothetical protein